MDEHSGAEINFFIGVCVLNWTKLIEKRLTCFRLAQEQFFFVYNRRHPTFLRDPDFLDTVSVQFSTSLISRNCMIITT